MRKLGLLVVAAVGCAAAQYAPAQTRAGPTVAAAAVTDATSTSQGLSANRNYDDIHTIVVIYAENRSFDNLYGTFPGANGLAMPP